MNLPVYTAKITGATACKPPSQKAICIYFIVAWTKIKYLFTGNFNFDLC